MNKLSIWYCCWYECTTHNSCMLCTIPMLNYAQQLHFVHNIYAQICKTGTTWAIVQLCMHCFPLWTICAHKVCLIVNKLKQMHTWDNLDKGCSSCILCYFTIEQFIPILSFQIIFQKNLKFDFVIIKKIFAFLLLLKLLHWLETYHFVTVHWIELDVANKTSAYKN